MHEIATQTLIAANHQERASLSLVLRRALRWVALLIALIFIADAGASLLVQRQHVGVRLNARLQAAFGRPVEVNRYSFSLWGGPTLKADGVRVGEDPRFGHEYFVYTDSLAIRLRWVSLLRGRFELQSLSLTSPTLNVVTDGTGDWNLAEWLGHPATSAARIAGPARPSSFVPRFREIDMEGGRVNFKRGDEKLPFAFVNVSGTISADGQERWRLDLEASPWRAAEIFQQAGTIHVAGSVGGTSSALRPAAFEVNWSDASISDFFHLVQGSDQNIRGTMSVALNAQTAANEWAIEGHADFSQLHRWDLTPRADDPSLSVNAKVALDLQASSLQINEAAIEAPHSNVRGSGTISWAEVTPIALKQDTSPVAISIRSATIDSGDLLSWLRAFRPGIPAGLTAVGIAQAHGNISGWPIRVVNFAAATSGVGLSGGSLAAPIHLGQAQLRYDQGALEILPTTITLAANEGTGGSFHVEMAPRTQPAVSAMGLHVSGSAANAGSLVAAAGALGWDVARGWQITGPFRCDLRWPDLVWPWRAQPIGTMSIGSSGDDGAELRAPFLNLPVTGVQARVDWKPAGPHVTLQSADAFGTGWSGALDRDPAAPGWQFDLSADRLDAADLDRWLNPRWRESLLDRMLPFLSSQPTISMPQGLRGSGHISIDQFSAAPFTFDNLESALTLDGRRITLDNATASVAGGSVLGSFDAQLAATPQYSARARFSGLNIASLTGDSDSDSTLGGTASGVLDLTMHGASRGDLAQSLDCKGAVDVRNATWGGISWLESLRAAKMVPGSSAFSEASGELSCSGAAVSLKNIVAAAARAEINGSGTVDFARNLDLDLSVAGGSSPTALSGTAPRAAAPPLRVTGTVSAPAFARVLSGRRPR